MAPPSRPLTALLFTPATRPERFAKAAVSGGDGVIIDWEDAVPAETKAHVRADTVERLRRLGPPVAEPCVTAVRVNDLRSEAGWADLAALSSIEKGIDLVVLPKVEAAEEVREAARRLPPSVRLLALIETVRGVRHAVEIAGADPRLAALAFGGFDLSAETGGEPVWDALLWPRLQVVHACAAANIIALDQPFLALDDDAGLETECARVRDLGFAGKLAVHPRQCAVIRRAFRPTPEQLAAARRVLAAAAASTSGVVAVDGRMVDLPVVRIARRIVEQAGG